MNFVRRQRVVVLAAALLAVAILGGAIPSVAQDALPLEQLLTKQEQARLGIASMSPEKREALRGALVRMFRQGQRSAPEVDRSASAAAGAAVVEAQVDGDFTGWEGKTIIKLSNGQIWQQTEYHYEYHYAYMPKVLIYPSGRGHKMRVDGTSKPIDVERLR
jgi:hypothetical protein